MCVDTHDSFTIVKFRRDYLIFLFSYLHMERSLEDETSINRAARNQSEISRKKGNVFSRTRKCPVFQSTRADRVIARYATLGQIRVLRELILT